MRDLRTRTLRTAVLLISILLTLVPAAAAADEDQAPPKPTCDEGQTLTYTGGLWICVSSEESGNQTNPGGTGSPSGGTSGNSSCTTGDGREVPCFDDYDRPYLAQWGGPPCYGSFVRRVEEGYEYPTPLAEGGTATAPGPGYLYVCVGAVPGVGDLLLGVQFVVPAGQAPAIDPAVLAQRAVNRMNFSVPEIGMAPQDPQRTTVGLETWLWVPDQQMGSMSLTVTAGPTSVTATASPTRVDWNLTEGSTSCYSAGREWIQGMSGNEQTDCSYTFSTVSRNQPNGKYPVTATIAYAVTWTCTGICLSDSGDLGEVSSQTSTTGIAVIERQTVVRRHPRTR